MGLGDLIEKITTYTGIKWLVKKAWKKFLNRKNQSELNRTEIKLVARLYSELYNVKYSEPCTCNGRIYKSWIEQINKKYESK